MLKYIVDAISKGLAFSKNEARGTFILSVFILILIVSSIFSKQSIRSASALPYDSAALTAWVAKVEASIVEKRTASKPVYVKSTVFMRTPPKSNEKETTNTPKAIASVRKDLNLSTAEDLQKIRGIGKAYSHRIIKYRDLLGGFSSDNQLNEVYGISLELVEKIKTDFYIESKPSPIPFNSDSVKLLANHPYVSYDLAWIIFNYRKQNGDIKSVEDLMQIKAIDDSLLRKLQPYLE